MASHLQGRMNYCQMADGNMNMQNILDAIPFPMPSNNPVIEKDQTGLTIELDQVLGLMIAYPFDSLITLVTDWGKIRLIAIFTMKTASRLLNEANVQQIAGTLGTVEVIWTP